ncbi:MAG: copper chaperone PCu(A)C [Oxalicibacterium faecigallinarum]|uniref:copper chaperone PCu(A)C n=1 Tax=Oxalicibacterium faecigallinarum TaxID=573741 RepID=UPI002807373B|nr:copper chaperone PCu(A)C [Oxalicibacterium faecigallinarum]MDQ7970148.1 copper chaperone PCu(A)C [Oxalicibacterium faecigallinarum]
MKLQLATLAIMTSLLAPLSQAQHVHGDSPIQIHQATARATVPGQTSGGAYLTLENHGKINDALLSAQSAAAKSMEIHTMSMEGNVMRMREVARIDIAAGQKVAMEPGKGYHLMLMGLKAPLKAGDKVPVTLTFEKAGKVETTLEVKDSQTANQKQGGHQH